MTDDTSAALERLKEIASRRDDGVAMYLWSEEARPILAHIADLEARAKEAEARAERAEAARLNVEGRWLAAESERRDAVQRAEWAEAFGHVFHALPDGRLDFVAVREGSPLGELHRRAGAAEAREAELRAALERLNAELDAFWNEPAEIKYPEGRMNVVYERLITDAQMACRQALAAAPAARRDALLPPLDTLKGKQYFAKDSDGQWYYLNHTRTWQTCPPVAPAAPASRESRVAKLERLLREARADVEYIADAESGSAEGAASRDLLADIDAALAESEGRDAE